MTWSGRERKFHWRINVIKITLNLYTIMPATNAREPKIIIARFAPASGPLAKGRPSCSLNQHRFKIRPGSISHNLHQFLRLRNALRKIRTVTIIRTEQRPKTNGLSADDSPGSVWSGQIVKGVQILDFPIGVGVQKIQIFNFNSISCDCKLFMLIA